MWAQTHLNHTNAIRILGGGVLATSYVVEDTDGNNQTISEITDYVQPPYYQVSQLIEIPPQNGDVIKQDTAYWEPYTYKSGIDTYLDDKYVVATSFDLDVCDKDRLVSGINTLGSNAQMFYNVVGGGRNDVANVSNIFVLCTSMVQIFAGATLKIIQ